MHKPDQPSADLTTGAASSIPAPEAAKAQGAEQEKPALNLGYDPNVKPTEPTKGEKAFNWTVYTGIGYFVNLFSSVVIADWFIDGKGRKILDKLTDVTYKAVEKSGATSPASARQFAFNAWKTCSLVLGGTILMFPIKMLEDNKRRLTFWANQKLGSDADPFKAGDQVPLKDIPDDQLPQIVEEPPKQSWLSVVTRRALSVAGVVTGSTILDRTIGNQKIEDATTKFVLGSMEKSGISPLQKLAKVPRFQRYTKLTMLDSIFTVISAAVIYATCPPEKPHINTAPPETADVKDAKTSEKQHAALEKAVEKAPEKPVEQPISPSTEAEAPEKAPKFADKVERAEKPIHKKNNENYADFVATEKAGATSSPTLAI